MAYDSSTDQKANGGTGLLASGGQTTTANAGAGGTSFVDSGGQLPQANAGTGATQATGSTGSGAITGASIPTSSGGNGADLTGQLTQQLLGGDQQTDWSQSLQPGGSGGIVGNPNQTSGNLVSGLTGRMNQSLNIDPQTDSIIKPQVDAYAANATRANRDLLNDSAEANGPYATGANTTAHTQAAEREAQGISGLQSQLVQNELNARRGDINSATSDLGGLLGADQQLNYQRQQGGVNANLSQQQLNNTLGLGVLGANLQQQGISNQDKQYYSGLSAQDQQFLNNLSYQYAGLNSANSNFDKNLAFQNKQLQSNNDQFAATNNLNTTNQANYWDAVRSGLL